MKLLLTFFSLAIIYKGVMDTGDPSGLFSSLVVFYAMYLLGYYESAFKYKNGFLTTAKVSVMIVAAFCFLGWLGIITIKEVSNQYYISFSDVMRLGELNLMNVHVFFTLLAVKMVLFAAMEWTIGLDKGNNGKIEKEHSKSKGA